MSDENYREIYRAHREAQSKYVYFLLAGVAAAIALAVNQTHEAKLSWSQLPLAGAVLCWAASFTCGCLHLQYVSRTLRANSTLLEVRAVGGADPLWEEEMSSRVEERMDRSNELASKHRHWQFRMLIAGAVFYIAWHVLEMWLRTVAAPARI